MRRNLARWDALVAYGAQRGWTLGRALTPEEEAMISHDRRCVAAFDRTWDDIARQLAEIEAAAGPDEQAHLEELRAWCKSLEFARHVEVPRDNGSMERDMAVLLSGMKNL
jgi:hypothetical protein